MVQSTVTAARLIAFPPQGKAKEHAARRRGADVLGSQPAHRTLRRIAESGLEMRHDPEGCGNPIRGRRRLARAVSSLTPH
jgi:hypothetical protein